MKERPAGGHTGPVDPELFVLRKSVGERPCLALYWGLFASRSAARAAVATGLEVEIPEGWELQVRPRSGLAWRHGLTVVNAPGTIDSDYRGEVRVLVVNLGAAPVTVARGERIAQLVLAPVTRAEFVPVDTLSATDRGAGGFGSTGS